MTAPQPSRLARIRLVIESIAVSWRDWPGRVTGLWRRSLQFRTVVITLVLSTVALAGTSFYMSRSIADDLYSARLEQVLGESARATSGVQQIFDSSSATSETELNDLVTQARSYVARAMPSANGLIGILRTPGQSGTTFVQDTISPDIDSSLIDTELRRTVAEGEAPQYYRAITLTIGEERVPGIVVGTRFDVPLAGQYELYAIADLSAEQNTLDFVQQTLLIGGAALILLIGGVAWVIVRLVVRPITVTAETSRRLAAGDLEVRMPQQGEDEFATLARSFNRMAGSLQDQITRLAELSQVQQRFVSDVSHELRTPLTTIRLAGDVLYDQRGAFEPATARAAELLHTQVERLESMLADLLEISRHDAGAVQLDLEASSLVRLVEGVVEGSQTIAREAGSDLRLVALGGYAQAEFDARRIRRIVRNLIDNAIEHGEGRPVVITVDSNETAVAVAVRDYGIGIDRENQERVFERFWRADPSRRRTLGGTGLGLAISMEDTVLHDGWLTVWSEPGQGSCFVLTLPRVAGQTLTRSPLPEVPTDAGVAS